MGNFVASLMAPAIVRKVRRERMTYMSYRKLNSFHAMLREALNGVADPLVIEFGVALGGSAAVAIHMLEAANRGHFVGFDMFGMIPPPSENDHADSKIRYKTIRSGESKGIKGDLYYGYEKDLKQKVVDNFAKVGLNAAQGRYTLVEGDFRQSFTNPGREVCFMHIDCDWHDSVAFCIEQAAVHLSPGGIVIVDDYNDYGGCRTAVDAFLAGHPDLFQILRTVPHLVMKKRSPP